MIVDDSVLAIHMGESFNRLSPLLQKAHLGKNRLTGFAQVKRGNIIARCICRLFGFPKQNLKSTLSVDCSHQSDSMSWRRSFDGLIMISHFRRKGEFLIESLGPLMMLFKAVESNGTLQYQYIRALFWGVPLPKFLSPQIIAFEKEEEGMYHFSVKVKMFLVGMVISYNGKLNVECLD
jgi:hypothetical protein